jgi:hypothetical protein
VLLDIKPLEAGPRNFPALPNKEDLIPPNPPSLAAPKYPRPPNSAALPIGLVSKFRHLFEVVFPYLILKLP